MKLFTTREKELKYEAYDFINSKCEQVNELLQTNKEVTLEIDYLGLKIEKICCEFLPKVGKKIIVKGSDYNYALNQTEWISFADDIIDYLGL